MKCYHCNAELKENAKFCRHCGAEIVIFCTECGKMLEKDAKFCPDCGTKVVQDEEKKNTTILPTVGEIALKAGEKVMEKVAGNISDTHLEEVRNAAPTQVDTSVRTETPASSTQGGGTGGGVTQNVKREPVSIHEAVEELTPAENVETPIEAVETPVAVEEVTTQASTAPNKRSGSVGTMQAEVPVETPTATPAPAKKSGASKLIKTGAEIGDGLIVDGTKTAVKGAVSALSTAKKVAIVAAVAAFVIGAATACLNFFVPAPDDTVDKLASSVEELDYDKMLSCFDSKTEKQVRAVVSLTGNIVGSLTGIDMDLNDLLTLAPTLAPYVEIPDLGIVDTEVILYADCSEKEIVEYCFAAYFDAPIPTGYLSDNEIVSFLMEYKITLPGLEKLIAKTAIVKITFENGEVGYLPLVNEGWGDWRIPADEFAHYLEILN